MTRQSQDSEISLPIYFGGVFELVFGIDKQTDGGGVLAQGPIDSLIRGVAGEPFILTFVLAATTIAAGDEWGGSLAVGWHLQ